MQPDYPVHQWTHSILDEPSVLNERKANSQALELAFEVSMMNGLTFAMTLAEHLIANDEVTPCKRCFLSPLC